ncbi:cold-shock protein [Roseibium salinum]|uniref:cold-shock protein n=1 Tax=Roseibium salinum TaxID=1604349 RepID=UPI0035F03695
MHDGDSDRRSRGRRGGKREFGGPQDFGSDFGGSGFGGDYGGGRDGGYRGGRDNDFGGGHGRNERDGGGRSGGYGNREGGYGGGREAGPGGDNRGGYGNREGGGGGYGGARSGGYGNREGAPGGGYGNREGGGGYGGARTGGYGNREGGEDRPRRDMPPVERGPRQSGTVKFFKTDKGFGFITPDEGDADVFVHISAVERSGLSALDSGQRISFETEPDRRGKGPKAVNLQVLEEGGSPAEEDGAEQ